MVFSSASLRKVTTRVELIDLLVHAAELEHALMCQYLFTAFTLKQPGDAGITVDQARLIKGWFDTIMRIAVQEMRHLAQACNLLTAVGGAPIVRRVGFPWHASYHMLGLESELAPFSADTIQRYACWEKPDWIEDLGCNRAPQPTGSSVVLAHSEHLARVADLIPGKRPYRSIGELYALVRSAFDTIPAEVLFIGPPSAQITNQRVPFREPLIAIDTPEDAHRAIDLIVIEGEGTPPPTAAAAPDELSHYARFQRILQELANEMARDPLFAPARPVIKNPIYAFLHQVDAVPPGANVITNTLARQVGVVFTASYDLTLQLLMRFFAHSGETEAQLQFLVDAALSLMAGAIRPLGCLLTRLPADDPARQDYPGLCAGPSFEVICQTQPIPNLRTAWLFFQERLRQIAAGCQNLSVTTDGLPELAEVAALLQFWAGTFVANGPAAP